jgi:hypothetical protein
MRKILICLMVLILLMSCAPEPGHEGGPCYEDGTCIWEVLACGPDGICYSCGDPEELCCEGNTCYECCACGLDGRCHICGGAEELCCEGDLCNEGATCGSDHICHSCGLDGDPCCEGDTCRIDPGFCGSDGLCHRCGRDGLPCCEGISCTEGHMCGLDQICHECGGYKDICCDGNVCDGWLICDSDSICTPCGVYDQPCCPGELCKEGYICLPDGFCTSCGVTVPCEGNTCNEGYYFEETDSKCHIYGYRDNRCIEGNICVGWYQCQNGICVNPFVVDSTSSLSICEAAEPGRSITERDWCYWYAAYHKDDTSICERIAWGEMREKCLDGKNPANYYVIPSF